MTRYLELVECICLAISIGNFIAVGFALKEKRQINKIMHLIVKKWNEKFHHNAVRIIC